MSSLEDTQPRSPFKEPPVPPPLLDPEGGDDSGGPGCVLPGCIGLVCVGLAVVIVLLSATAGWTAGQRVAQTNATATQSAEIQVQLGRIPTDVASGNQYLLSRRLDYLATLTPGVPGVGEIMQTATALYLTSQPTPAPTETPTPTPTVPATLQAEAAAPIVQTQPSSAGGFDLNQLLDEARAFISLREWSDAIETLDAIIALDKTFQTEAVNRLMLQSLREQASALYNSGKIAEAILLTDRAEEFGLSQDDPLRYERYVGGLYLDAIRTVGTDYASAIRALRSIYNLGQGRYYSEVQRLLFSQYVAYGDAWVAQGSHCAAVPQYDGALSILSSAEVSAKRENANTLCLQGTPVLTPGQTPIAPVGETGS